MTLSHVCTTCGLDLARQPAVPEARYGLPLVTCRGCGAVAVRPPDALRTQGRAVRRFLVAVAVLLTQLALLGLFAVAVTGASALGADTLLGRIDPPAATDDRFAAVLLLGAVPLALGTWLTAGLAHWRWWTPWAAFGVLVALVSSLDCVVMPAVSLGLVALAPDLVPLTESERHVTGRIAPPPIEWERWGMRLPVLVVLLGVAVAGVPLGRLALRAAHAARLRAWAARRRRGRARRAGA